ncbi:MAG: hypothetical protein LBC86_05435 [Oscillospiraceae bacterium]|jgi:hypothetical protein|nr:hypothetical protein [Oscillospiraceae bacterium]
MKRLKGTWRWEHQRQPGSNISFSFFYKFTSDSEYTGRFTSDNLMGGRTISGTYEVIPSKNVIEFTPIGESRAEDKYVIKYRWDGRGLTLHTETRPSTYYKSCYVATCVYGSYNCPEVWVLRRYRDNTLSNSYFGRKFISTYYAISPKIVELFGNRKWFHRICKPFVNAVVLRLRKKGVDDSPYSDN